MHCSDLERYLEACLDGRLGEARRLLLRQHLATCRGCHERVEGLRRFEADLQRRLRAMRHEASLWSPLGHEVTADVAPPRPALPLRPSLAARGPLPARPPRPRHQLLRPALAGTPEQARPGRRRLQSLAGVALILAAVGTLVDFAAGGLGWLGGDKGAAAYRAYVAGEVALELETAEPAELLGWLGERLGGRVSLPAGLGRFELVGGSATDAGAATVVYAAEGVPVLLLIEAAKAPAAAAPVPVADVADGLTRLDWQQGEHAYSLISALPPDKLSLFPVPAATVP